jgi:SAM-dependent methyltransferase
MILLMKADVGTALYIQPLGAELDGFCSSMQGGRAATAQQMLWMQLQRACRRQCADRFLSDLLSNAGAYDVVLLEMGVLHYFIDVTPLLTVVKQLLKPGGRLLLREFHPVSTKLIKDKANGFGNYFSQELVVSSVAYSKHSTPDHRHKRLQAADVGGGPCTRLRQWGLGEVVTAVCDSGLVLSCLEEGPTVKLADQGLPKLFTLVAVKSC